MCRHRHSAVYLARSFAATPTGYEELLTWARSLGTVTHAGVEGTGSYGAVLMHTFVAAGITVMEVNCHDRARRRRRGKSDPTDAENAARAVQARTRRSATGQEGHAVSASVTWWTPGLVSPRTERGNGSATITCCLFRVLLYARNDGCVRYRSTAGTCERQCAPVTRQFVINAKEHLS